MSSKNIYNIHFNPKSKEGYFILRHVNPNLDYIDVNENVKIETIYKNKVDGLYYAVTIEQNENIDFSLYERVWGR